MSRICHRLSVCLAALGLASVAMHATVRAEDLVFLSTQLRPVEEAQQFRDVILKNAPAPVNFVPEMPPQLPLRVKAEQQGGAHTISLIGALHGELQPLAALDALLPLDELAAKLTSRGFPDNLLTLAKFGGEHPMYIPWMQATYLMAANKLALPYLPAGADLNALTYDQLAEWSANIQAKTGKRMLGFPAGPQGLLPRFFEGYLYPSFTGGLVVPFKSPAAEAMWSQFAALWKTVTPNSTNYNFMQEPLLSGDIWIAWDHIVRLQDALRQRPNDFVAFPAPAGAKGRGYLPVIVGLAVDKTAPDKAGALAAIEYLTRPDIQLLTLRTASFFPTGDAKVPTDLDAGLKLGADAIALMQRAPDARASLLPVGLGSKGGEFDKVFIDTFQLIVLRGQKPHDVLTREGEVMQKILNDTGAPCWSPDQPSSGPCQVQ